MGNVFGVVGVGGNVIWAGTVLRLISDRKRDLCRGKYNR